MDESGPRADRADGVQVLLVGDAGPSAGDLEAAGDGLAVEAVADRDAALRRLDHDADAGSPVDCVVVAGGPADEALDLLAAVRDAYPHLPVVLAPADGSEAVASEATRLDASDYLPWDPEAPPVDALAERVAARVARRREDGEEQRLRVIAEHLPSTVIWMTDLAFSTVHYVSPGYEELWGRPVDRLYDDPAAFAEGVHPDDRGRVLEAMQALVEAPAGDGVRRTDPIEYRVVRPDGGVSWVQGLTVGLPGDDGAVERWVGIATDVTQRKARERELEGYRTIHETVPDGVFLLDEVGTMHHVNEAWASMLEVAPGALEGSHFTDLVDQGLVDASVTEQYRDLLRVLLSADNDRDRGTMTLRASLPGHAREHVFEAHVGLLPYEEAFRGTAVVIRDVTAMQRRLDG